MAVKSSAEKIEAIRLGYTFSAESIALGGALVDGRLRPEAQIRLPLGMMSRHGLVAGATGTRTGKTVTLHMIVEQLSRAGVPVFMADIKGDLSGLATVGTAGEKLTARTQSLGQDWSAKAFPVEFLSLGGDGNGVPVRASITSFGPILLSRVLGLNETQESSLQLIFHFAATQAPDRFDLQDLRAVLAFLTSDEGNQALTELGGLS